MRSSLSERPSWRDNEVLLLEHQVGRRVLWITSSRLMVTHSQAGQAPVAELEIRTQEVREICTALVFEAWRAIVGSAMTLIGLMLASLDLWLKPPGQFGVSIYSLLLGLAFAAAVAGVLTVLGRYQPAVRIETASGTHHTLQCSGDERVVNGQRLAMALKLARTLQEA